MKEEIILAIIQGLTEFLPISSSGHLALFGNSFNRVDVGYFSFLHLASVFAILLYTRKEIIKLTKFDNQSKKLLLYLLIGIIPAGLIGLLFNSFIETTFSSITFLGFSFLLTGIIVFTSFYFKNPKGKLNFNRSLIIGLSQILALFPGISRSGTTISFGLFSGLNKKEAFRFSFLMAIPLIIGAFILEFNLSLISLESILGFIVCFIVSLISLFIVEKAIEKDYFWIFGIYCIILGILILILYVF